MYHSLKERVFMDKMPILKLTPIEQGERKLELRNIDMGQAAPAGAQKREYEVSESLKKLLNQPKSGRIKSRMRSFASSSAARFRSAAKTSRRRVSSVRRPSAARARAKGEKPPFATTIQGQIAICSGVILLALALKVIDTPQTQSVSATVEQAITTETNLDQNLGRLQFVQNMFSDSVAVFWQKAPDKLQSPFNGRVSAKYSLTTPGIEITGKESDVYACYDGRVSDVAEDEEGNFTVTISHSGGLNTVYARLLATDVKAKDRVKKGDRIGLAQEKGEGYAMFLQVQLNDLVVDPLPYFQE
jgi:murein DD-endopeptidase MepM/ murein hydrolase activator NlpD